MIETCLQSKHIHTGPVLRLTHDTVRLPDGEQALREVAWHPGGVVILPQLTPQTVILVEQFRYPTGQTLLEFPAGKLNLNEDPLAAAKRELLEETGYEAEVWTALGFIYTAPGFTNEKLYLFKASQLTAHPDPPREPDEFIELHTVATETLKQWHTTGKLLDAKTLCLLHHL
ncbi:MAG: NUDIX hydrolase [Vampirovibrionales bacterium]|nr:NUDIX hydrolase [Vampirovibrionales bacterium]